MKLTIIKRVFFPLIYCSFLCGNILALPVCDNDVSRGGGIKDSSGDFSYAGVPSIDRGGNSNITWSGGVTLNPEYSPGYPQAILYCTDGETRRCETHVSDYDSDYVVCNQGEGIGLIDSGYYCFGGGYSFSKRSDVSYCKVQEGSASADIELYIAGEDASGSRICQVSFDVDPGYYNSLDLGSRNIDNEFLVDGKRVFPINIIHYYCGDGELREFLRGSDTDMSYTCPEGERMTIVLSRTDLDSGPEPESYAAMEATLRKIKESNGSNKKGVVGIGTAILAGILLL